MNKRMNKIKLQKRHIFMIIALTAVSVILAVSLFFYQKSGGINGQTIPTGLLIALLILLILLPILLVIFILVKKTKISRFIGYAVVVISFIIIAFMLFIAGGMFDSRPKLIFLSGTLSKEYDGTPLSCTEWQQIGGELDRGHSAEAKLTASRTDAGSSPNYFSVTVRDEDGADVTNNYNIEKNFGELTVLKRNISISTSSYSRVYDANPLICNEWKCVSETKILSSHKMSVTVSGSQTDVGISKNSIAQVLITQGEKNVSDNYSVTYLEGDLIVSPRKITVRSESANKKYDGIPLINHNWTIESQTRIVENQTLSVVISGTRTEPGESINTIAETLIKTSSGKDVSFNYEIKLQEGSLIVGDNSVTDPENPGEGDSTAGDLDESGKIGGGGLGEGGGGNAERIVSARVYSDNTSRIYLRYMNFGNYNGKIWEQAKDYPKLIDSKYSMNYLTGISLKNAGYKSTSTIIESFSNNYLLPLYLDTDELSYKIQTSDVQNAGSTAFMYSAYYYEYSFENDILSAELPVKYKAIEQEYAKYVNSAYLSIPDKTNMFFKGIINKYDFNKNDADIVFKVAEYIRNAAVYNGNYDIGLDDSDDIAVSFLSEYKQGICQHFATAATMFYRALGIPARYVIGYSGNTKSGEWVDFLPGNAHAWVEVYISGIGWVQVEATPAGFGAGGEIGDGSPNSSDVLKIKPVDVYMPYTNGVVLRPENTVQGLSELLSKGYNYTAKVTGKQTTVGIGFSSISSFNLFDSSGKDVTKNFKIIFGKGKLHLYVRELTVTTESLSKTYDAMSLKSENTENVVWEGELIGGHSFENLVMTGIRTDVGQRENSCNIKIVDELGDDVTFMYKINKNYGVLIVKARQIILTAGSASKIYNGIELTCPFYELTALEGELPLGQGDIIAVQLKGSQTNIGKSQNEISSVHITNKHGVNVTGNYSIVYISGWLVVNR